MDRGVVVGGALICASFLLAVLLNQSEIESPVPLEPKREQPARERSCDEPALNQQRPSEPSAADVQPVDC